MQALFRRLALPLAFAGALVGSVAPAQTTIRPDWKERFRAHDLNGDSRIDRGEFQEWMVEVFFQRDQGKKGYLTLEDVRGAMTPEVFKAMNRRADGKLGLAEFLNALFEDFRAIDAGQQGSITVDQVEAYVRQAR
jgi:Ca2+-binding EF-hand superfamily protein